MTIIVAGTVDLEPDKVDAALEAGIPHVLAARAEQGCVHYVWSKDPTQPGRIYVFEEWETQEDLAAHLTAEPYFNMRDTIGSFGLLAADNKKYRVDLSEPVYDETMTPRADFFTEGG